MHVAPAVVSQDLTTEHGMTGFRPGKEQGSFHLAYPCSNIPAVTRCWDYQSIFIDPAFLFLSHFNLTCCVTLPATPYPILSQPSVSNRNSNHDHGSRCLFMECEMEGVTAKEDEADWKYEVSLEIKRADNHTKDIR